MFDMFDSFCSQMNKTMVGAMNLNVAFFMQTKDINVSFMTNSFTGNPITGANFFNLQFQNAINGTNHTEYVNMNDTLSSKPHWLSNLGNRNGLRGTLFQEDTHSGPRYSFLLPTAELNQNIFADGMNRQRSHYIPFQSHNATMNNFSDFVTEQFTNAVNASYTGTPYRNNLSENELGTFKAKLIEEIERNPRFVAEMANKAHQEVMDRQYLPFNKTNFIEKAQDTGSKEFNQLSTALTSHVSDMVTNNKLSFNREFNDLAKPLIANFEYVKDNDTDLKTSIGEKTVEFVKEKIKQPNAAGIMADTFAGTFIEKANALAPGDKILAGLQTACVLVNNGISLVDKVADRAEQLADKVIEKAVNKAGDLVDRVLDKTEQFVGKVVDKVGSFVDKVADHAGKFIDKIVNKSGETASETRDVMIKHGIPENYPDSSKVVINNTEFKGNELSKIMNFDNVPFSMTGKEKVESKDYEIAHKAEKAVLEMTPTINKDEYQKDMANNQIVSFLKTATQKMGSMDLTSDKTIKDVIKVAGNIAVSQGLKGDNMLNTIKESKDTRSFFAGLNDAIHEMPQALDNAVSKVQQTARAPAATRR